MSPDGPAPALFEGVPYEYATVVAGGSLIFTAGACPIDAEGFVVAVGDVVAQAHATYDNLRAMLARYGADVEHIVRTTVYVVGDRTALVNGWSAVAQRLLPHKPPSTLLGVTGLGYPEQLIEIEAIAALP